MNQKHFEQSSKQRTIKTHTQTTSQHNQTHTHTIKHNTHKTHTKQNSVTQTYAMN